MVVSRGIWLSLQSPEARNPLMPGCLEEFMPPSTDTFGEEPNIATRYVLVQPGSIFWLRYRIFSPPTPDLETKLYVFKLFINNAHFTTWCVDGDNMDPELRWKGNCMFGLFENTTRLDESHRERKLFQKRAFAFAAPSRVSAEVKSTDGPDGKERSETFKNNCGRNKLQKKRRNESSVAQQTSAEAHNDHVRQEESHDRQVEVRVFRAKSKRRVPRVYPPFNIKAYGTHEGMCLDLVYAGSAPKPHPQRHYEFDLLDAKDQPYVTFRFLYRTVDELKALGIVMGDEEALSTEADSTDSQTTITPERKPKSKESMASLDQTFEQISPQRVSFRLPRANHSGPMKSPSISQQNVSEEEPDDDEPNIKRLSIPPSVRLLPTIGNWIRNPMAAKSHSESEVTIKGEVGPRSKTKSSVETLQKRGSQNIWRAFQEEREAEHGGD